MPSVSEKQRRFMGMVHAYKQGKLKDASEEVKKAASSISDKDAKEFASSVEDEEIGESETTENQMTLLQELYAIVLEAKKKKKAAVSRTAAAKVYHRDYERTKNKAYRKYDPEDRNQAD